MDFKLKNYINSPFEFLKIHGEMKKVRKYNKKELEKYTFEKMKEVCIYAFLHVPYYKELFAENNINPYEFKNIDDFKCIPILSKDTIRERYNDLISDEVDKINGVVVNETSGSTGTPLRFLCDGRQNMAVFNLFWQVWSVGDGWHIGKRQAMIGGYTEGMYKYNPINQILYMSSFELSKKTVRLYYDMLIKYKPTMLRGYPSALYLFANLLNEEGLSLKYKTVFCYAETLLPFQRELIEKTFQAKVIDQYSQQESIACICECECGRKHAYSNFAYHEIVDENGYDVEKGKEGRLVCTGYFNRVMPLIRYDTRDLATFSVNDTCECDLSFPLVDNIFGRIEDVITTPEGRRVGRLDAAFKYSEGIKLASIYQPDISKIIVKLAMVDGQELSESDPLISELRKRLGNEIIIEICYVSEDEIPRTKGGKVRFVLSDVGSN